MDRGGGVPAARRASRGSRGQSRRKAEASRSGAKAKQFTFEIFFPQPGSAARYFGAHYRAARGKDGLYNFVGLVLGHGGATVQRIQKASGAKIELRDSSGNLNGAHPGSHSDPSLHAWVAAASRQRLDKAVGLLLEVLQPSNTRLHAVDVVPGGSVHLHPIIPSDWPEAAEAAVAAVAQATACKQAAALAQGSAAAAPAPSSIWASTGFVGSFPLPSVGSPAGLDASAPLSGSGSSTGGSDEEVDEEEALACLGLLSYPSPADSPASVVSRRTRERAAPAGAKASAELASLASIWAATTTSLGGQQGAAERPSSPSSSDASTRSSSGSDSVPTRSGSSSDSWTLWESGSSPAASFYEQLQAASDSIFTAQPAKPASAAALLAPAQPLHGGAAPFPGLVRPAVAPSLGLVPGIAVGVPVSGFTAPLAAREVCGHPVAGAPSAVAAERDMAQLLAAVASMATLE